MEKPCILCSRCQGRVMKFLLRATSFASVGNHFSPLSATSTTQARSSSMESLMDLDDFAPAFSPITPKAGEEASGGSSGEEADQSGNCDTSANTSAIQEDFDRVYQLELAKAHCEKGMCGEAVEEDVAAGEEDDWEPMYKCPEIPPSGNATAAKDPWDLPIEEGEIESEPVKNDWDLGPSAPAAEKVEALPSEVNAAANEFEGGQEAEVKRLLCM